MSFGHEWRINGATEVWTVDQEPFVSPGAPMRLSPQITSSGSRVSSPLPAELGQLYHALSTLLVSSERLRYVYICYWWNAGNVNVR